MAQDVRPTGTYKTLDEQREVLSPAEQRFEKARQTIGLFLGPVVFLIMYFLPLPLERDQQTLAMLLVAFSVSLGACGQQEVQPEEDQPAQEEPAGTGAPQEEEGESD